ncbi:MAG: HAD hydrolase-like protein [Hyphomonas sp.]
MAYREPGLLSAENLKTLEEAQGYLVDWDGCCAVENQLVPSAMAFLKANHACCAIVSNNSSNTVDDFAEILGRSGIPMSKDQIILAGVESLTRAAEIDAEGVLVLGDTRMRGLARNLGLPLAKENIDLVVLLRDTRMTYNRLELAANALANGARLIVANPDLTHPGVDGRLKPETGALLAALGACVDLGSVDIEIIGKPGRHLFDKGCAAIGAAYEDVVMFGDNPATDISGADALGMNSLLVSPSPGVFFDSILDATKTA